MGRNLGSKDNVRIMLKPLVLQRCVNCRSVSANAAALCDVFCTNGTSASMVGAAIRRSRILPKPLGSCTSLATATATKWLRSWALEPGRLGLVMSLRQVCQSSLSRRGRRKRRTKRQPARPPRGGRAGSKGSARAPQRPAASRQPPGATKGPLGMSQLGSGPALTHEAGSRVRSGARCRTECRWRFRLPASRRASYRPPTTSRRPCS